MQYANVYKSALYSLFMTIFHAETSPIRNVRKLLSILDSSGHKREQDFRLSGRRY